MFVAGLSEGTGSTSTGHRTNRDRSASVISSSSYRRASHGASSLDPHASASVAGLNLTSPLTSPGSSHAALPPQPPFGEQLENSSLDSEPDPRDAEFQGLLENLRGALAPKGEKGRVWVPDSDRKEFRILLVDKVRTCNG